METTQQIRPAVELSDSLSVEGSVVLAHRQGHKLMSVAVLTRAELAAFVQQAHDLYGVTADPFATPGSADAEAWVDGDKIRHHGEVYERRGGHWSTGGVNRPGMADDRAAENTLRFYPHTTEVLRRGGVDAAPRCGAQCGDPCRHDAECPHGRAWTEGETCGRCLA